MKIFMIALLFPFLIFAETITVSWNANTESDLSGYKIYYGTSSGSYDDEVDVGNTTSFSINNLVVGTTYYFVVTAYDFSGNESGFSKEIAFTSQNLSRPTIKWFDTEVDTMVVVLDSSATKIALLKMTIKSDHAESTTIDLIQIDFNDKFWSVVGTVIFTNENGIWKTDNKISGIKPGKYYAINSRVHALGGSWSDWGSPISKRFKIEVLDKIISETIVISIAVQIP